MKAPTAVELAELNSVAAEEISYEEKKQRAERSLPVKLYPAVFGMGRHLLGCALFSVTKSSKGRVVSYRDNGEKVIERREINVTLPSFRGASIEYKGPELRQDDATVWLALVHRTREGLVDATVEFDPREFAASIGWDAHKKSVDKLAVCIERMQSALVRLTINETSGLRAALVGAFDWSPERWSVRLDPRIVGLFEGGTTFLPRAERAQLTDGLQTWLASFLRAQSDENIFELADLAKFSGSEAVLKTFGEQVRETLPKLVAAGVVKGFSFGRGKLRVER